jgi:hypothetical protein
MPDRDNIQASMSQSLLLQIIEQLSGVDQRIGVLQGQTMEVIREQARAADGRKLIWEQMNRIPGIEATIARMGPLVDKHETKHNEAAGALSLGRIMLGLVSGALGAGLTIVAKKMGLV